MASRYSDLEINVIKKYYSREGSKECKKYIKRSAKNIRLKAKELGLNRDKTSYKYKNKKLVFHQEKKKKIKVEKIISKKNDRKYCLREKRFCLGYNICNGYDFLPPIDCINGSKYVPEEYKTAVFYTHRY